MLLVSDRRLQKQRSQLLQTDVGSIPDKDVFCGSETVHDNRTVPRQKLFVLARKLQEQRPEHYKSVLVKMFL
jgi:hypothetical protein